MTRGCVVDCSAIMGLCFEDEFNHFHASILDKIIAERFYVPTIWIAEVGNALVIAERRKRITPADSARFILTLKKLQIEIIPTNKIDELSEIAALAREFKLTYYDAQYLHLSLFHGFSIYTLDSALRKAARKAGVNVL